MNDPGTITSKRTVPPPFPHHTDHECNPFGDPTKRCTLSLMGGLSICQTCGYIIESARPHDCHG